MNRVWMHHGLFNLAFDDQCSCYGSKEREREWSNKWRGGTSRVMLMELGMKNVPRPRLEPGILIISICW